MSVKDEDVDFAYDLIKNICEKVGPGVPASPQERERGEIVKNSMESLGLDSVELEEFSFHPGAFFGWFRLAVVLGVTSLLLYLLGRLSSDPSILRVTALIAFVLSALIILITVMEFFLYKEFVDFLFPKATSQNIVGTMRHPTLKGDPERIILFGGHHDSAWEFTWLKRLGFGYYIALMFIFLGIISLLVVTTIQMILALVAPDAIVGWRFLDYLLIVVFPVGMFFAFFFVGSGENGGTVPGANDDLSGVAISVAMARILKRHPELIPTGTEFQFVSFGSEEAGTRGSKRYAAKHLEELRRANALCVVYDTIATERMSFFNTDRNSTVKLSKPLAESFGRAAESLNLPYHVGPFPVLGGGTDALAFGERGLETVSVYAMKLPDQMTAWYHQSWDDIDKVDKVALGNALKITVAWLAGLAKSE